MSVVRLIITYLISHWRGQQPLAWSFWVNLLALRICIFSAQSWLAPLDGDDYSRWQIPILVATFLIHCLVLCWQIVGVIRSADRHFASHGNMAVVWGAQLGATLMFILSAVYILGAVQTGFGPAPENAVATDRVREHVRNYTILVSGKQLAIEGDIEPGMMREVQHYLDNNPLVKQVHLRSSGGNIFEARGLSRLFTRHKVATYVKERCASACTIAYIGGVSRQASATAVFGFHQYRMDSPFPAVITTAEAEQQIDEALFIEAGVKEEFVRIMFDKNADDMWWPSMGVLQRSGVVHELR